MNNLYLLLHWYNIHLLHCCPNCQCLQHLELLRKYKESEDLYYQSIRVGIEKYCADHDIHVVRTFHSDTNYPNTLKELDGLICIGKFNKEQIVSFQNLNSNTLGIEKLLILVVKRFYLITAFILKNVKMPLFAIVKIIPLNMKLTFMKKALLLNQAMKWQKN